MNFGLGLGGGGGLGVADSAAGSFDIWWGFRERGVSVRRFGNCASDVDTLFISMEKSTYSPQP